MQHCTMKHADSKLGLFAARRRGKGSIVGILYEWMVYYSLGTRWGPQECYQEEMLKASVGEFWKWQNQLSREVSVRGLIHLVYTAPAHNCVMSFLNDPLYLTVYM